MKSRLVWVVTFASTLLMLATQTNFASAKLNFITSNPLPHNISTAQWIVFAGANSASSATGLPYGPVTPATDRSFCTVPPSYSKTVTSVWTAGGKKVELSDVTNLVAGMLVSGTGITGSGTNTISTVDSQVKGNPAVGVTLTTGNNTSPISTVLTFTTAPVCTSQFDQFLTVKNSGSLNISGLTITQTVNTTNGLSIALQSCSGSWDEVNGTCSGAISTIMTTIGAGTGVNSPQTVSNVPLPINAGGNVRLRLFSTQAGKTSTISVSISNANVRTATDTNA